MSKVATVVSKKVSAKAVIRNTVKRRMRAALAALEIPTGYGIMLAAKKPAADASFAELKADVSDLVARLRSGK